MRYLIGAVFLFVTGCGFHVPSPTVTGSSTTYGVKIEITDNETVDGFDIFRQEQGNPAPYTMLNDVPYTNTSFLDETVTAGHTYSYYVEAERDSVRSAPSNTVTLTIPRQ